MRTTNSFYYDDNEFLKLVQHQLQNNWMLHYFRTVREMINFSLRLIPDNQSDLAPLSDIMEFNPRALLSTHNIMAAIFRHREHNINQGDLFEKTSIYDKYRQKWTAWFRREAEILKMSPAFVKYFANVIMLDNSEDGKHFGSKLTNYLVVNYSCEEWLDMGNIDRPLFFHS